MFTIFLDKKHYLDPRMNVLHLGLYCMHMAWSYPDNTV